MIRGLQAMFYSSQANELREFLRDKLGFSGTDVGDGWLIFDTPEADIGVHPTDGNDPASDTADISFLLRSTSMIRCGLFGHAEVEFTQEVEDHGYGLVTYFKVPAGFAVQLYEPKYSK